MTDEDSGSLFQRLIALFVSDSTDEEQLVNQLREAEQQGVLGREALLMIEGVMRISKSRVRDVMVPRSRMVVLNKGDDLETMISSVISSTHSRFPVVGDDRDEVVGMVLAKDFLQYLGPREGSEFNLKDILRPAIFIPESKRLNVLLREFRTNRNHMAVVADEYGGVAGLVTIEDVLEEIVGEIEDETDIDDDDENLIEEIEPGLFQVQGLTLIEDFNQYFGAELGEDEFDTLGGLVASSFGHLPDVGEEIELSGFHFQVESADQRRIETLVVKRSLGEPAAPSTD